MANAGQYWYENVEEIRKIRVYDKDISVADETTKNVYVFDSDCWDTDDGVNCIKPENLVANRQGRWKKVFTILNTASGEEIVNAVNTLLEQTTWQDEDPNEVVQKVNDSLGHVSWQTGVGGLSSAKDIVDSLDEYFGSTDRRSQVLELSEGDRYILDNFQISSAMPTSGSYVAGKRVYNLEYVTKEDGGVTKILDGWRRLTTGSNHLLYTDWEEILIPLGDRNKPYIVTATVENANSDDIVITFNENLDESSVPATTDFSLNLGKSVSSVVVSGAIITLTVNSAYAYGDVITISYSKGVNTIKDISANEADEFVDFEITNNVATSPETGYFVDFTGGSDSNDGLSSTSAWKTLTKVNSSTFVPGDIIQFKRGESWEGTLTPGQSGTSENPITYTAYGTGDKPKILGTLPITSWSLHSGSIYKADYATSINQLFVNDTRMKVARTPNSGYHLITSVQSSTTFTCTSLDGSKNYVGSTWVGRTETWAIYYRTVTAQSNQTLTLNSAPTYGLGVGEGFFLCGGLDLLDQPGEWTQDGDVVYLRTAASDNPSGYTVRGSSSENGISMTSVSYISIENLEISQQRSYGVNVNNCSNITIDGNDITDQDKKGIYMHSTSSSMTITNNNISGCNNDGIWNDGSIDNSTIQDNTISNIALFDSLGLSGMGSSNTDGCGIQVDGDNMVIQYNSITNVAYHGIRFNGINNSIDKNFIQDACVVKDDGGGIYAFSSDPSLPGIQGSTITNNIVLNVLGTNEGTNLNRRITSGIYMDNNLHDVTISNNTVAASANGGIFLHENKSMLVQNNTVYDARYGIYINEDLDANTIDSNIVFTLLRDPENYSNERLIGLRYTNSTHSIDNNSYYSPYNTSGEFRYLENFLTWSNWLSTTPYDDNSTFDGTALGAGETEVLFYNNQKTAQAQDLSGYTWRDLAGDPVASLTLQPFTSQILIRE